MELEYMDRRIDDVDKKVDEHETRIRKLEESRMEQKLELAEIKKDLAEQGKNIAELRSFIMESNDKMEAKIDDILSKSLDKQNETQKVIIDMFSKYLQSDIDIKKSDNKHKWEVFKKILPWIITSISTLVALREKVLPNVDKFN